MYVSVSLFCRVTSICLLCADVLNYRSSAEQKLTLLVGAFSAIIGMPGPLEVYASIGTQVFRDMKVQSSFSECTAEHIRSVLGRLAHGEGTSAAQEARNRPTRAEHIPSKAADSAAENPPEPSQPAVSRATSGSAAQRPQSDSAANRREPGSAGKSSEASGQDNARFAPLAGKDAVSGAQRMMPGGKKGYFW